MNRSSADVRGRIMAIYAGLALFHVLVWTSRLAAFHAQPFLGGAAVLAYALGLRHGVDADRLAAIDNVTRRQMQNGRRPVTVGLFFALGHTTVVMAAFVAIALLASSLEGSLRNLRALGAVSAAFLLAIGLANAVAFAVSAMIVPMLLIAWRAHGRRSKPAGRLCMRPSPPKNSSGRRGSRHALQAVSPLDLA